MQIQTAARPAGFDVQIESVPGADFHTGRYAKIWQSLISVQAPWAITPIYTLNLQTGVDSQNNMSDWEDQTFYDALTASAAVIDQGSAEAGASWNAAEKRLLEEAPFIQIAQVQPGVAISDRVSGWAWRTDNTIDYAHLSLTE